MTARNEVIQSVLAKYCSDFRNEFCIVPINSISFGNDYRILDLLKWQMELYLSTGGIEVKGVYDYNVKNVIFYKVGIKMPLSFTYTLKIPYECRTQYLPAVKELNKVVPSSGCITLFVDNNPYHLEAYLVIESPSMQDDIERIIRKYSMKQIYQKGLSEFFTEMEDRRWNAVSFPPDDGSLVETIFLRQFLIAEEDAIRSKGYHPEVEKVRPRLFISYCHADKRIVSEIVTYMQSHGVYCWWDEQEIDFGDSIVERVHAGVRDCSLAIIFISEATVNALFAQHELRTFMQEKIYHKKEWFIVRLDSVNPDDVIEGLSGYKYYDFFSDPDVSHLAETVSRKLEKI